MSENIYNPVTKKLEPFANVTAATLGGLADVNISDIQDGDRIKWNRQTESWENGPGAKSDWANDNPTDDSYIANKPTLGNAASVNTTNTATQNSQDAFTSGGAYTALAGKANKSTSLAGYGITNAYTKDEIDELFAEHENNISWKTAVATYADIATTYPDPQEGWTVCCTDTNIVWRYSGGQWVQISANTIPVASASEDGLMSKTMFTKLNNLPAGAEVNQNAFSNVKVGSTTVAADGKTDTLELVGSNVTLTPDATNDKVTIGITKGNVTSALGYTPPSSDTNTHRPIQMNGTQILGDNVTALNLKAGSNVSLSNSGGTVTINSSYTNTTTGTTYAAGSAPNNTTFGTNGSIKNVYDAVKVPCYWYSKTSGTSSQRVTVNSSVVINGLDSVQCQYGRGIAIVTLDAVELKMPNQWTDYVIASNLPAKYFGCVVGSVQTQDGNQAYAIFVNDNRQLVIRSDMKNGTFWLRGQIVYFTTW